MHGHACSRSSTGLSKVLQFEKEQGGAESLILSGRRNFFLAREKGQELAYFLGAHVRWMSLLMKEHKLSNPVDVAFFSR